MPRLAPAGRVLRLFTAAPITTTATTAAAAAATTCAASSLASPFAVVLPAAPGSLLCPPPPPPRLRPPAHADNTPPLPPALCGEPKNKLSVHRRGHRRTAYHLKRSPLFARCPSCGAVGGPHEFLPRAGAGGACTGGCLPPGAGEVGGRTYRPEYKPPV